jgi:hypothetical protein
MNKSVTQLLFFILIAVALACVLMCFMAAIITFSCGNPELWSEEERKIFISSAILFLFLSIGGAIAIFYDKKD